CPIPVPSTSTATLFPYTTLFRSQDPRDCEAAARCRRHRDHGRQSGRGGGVARRRCAGRLPPVAGEAATGGRRPAHRRRATPPPRSEEHTSELQSRENLVCRLLLE